MAILRRILKCTPATVLVLLVVVWVVGLYWSVQGPLDPRGRLSMVILESSAGVMYRPRGGMEFQVTPSLPSLAVVDGSSLGHFICGLSEMLVLLAAPLPFLMTAILPLAIGPFLSFRFRLWHYLAYTTLVAVELAYYLQ